MITLEEIEIEGFGSLAKLFKFNLKQNGLNILNSRNGRGKTTIFSALCWVLYGKSLKNKSQVETWEDKRPKGWKGTMVTVRFATDPGDKVTRIYRCIKYRDRVGGASGGSRLIIVEDGKEIEFKDKKAAQKWIDKKMGMSFDLFKNTVVFGQKMKRFIEEDGPTKKAIFEEIFDTAYIQGAKKLAEELRDGYQKDIAADNHNLEKMGIKLEGLIKLRSTLDKQVKDFEKIQQRDLRRQREYRKEIREELSTLRAHHGPDFNEVLNSLKVRLAEAGKIGKEISRLENEAFKLDFKIQQDEASFNGSKKEHKRFVNELAKKHFTCSLCKQKLDPKHQQQHTKQLKQYIAEEKAKQFKMEPLLGESKKEYGKYIKLIHKLKERTKGIVELEDAIYDQKQVIARAAELEKDKKNSLKIISELKKEKPNTEELEKVKREINTLESKLSPLQSRINYLETQLGDCLWVIKDPLSNSGIKAFIFSQMIKKVNHKLLNYSHIINGQIQFGVDLGTGNRDFYITINRDGHIRFYADLSGGEQQLINICIAFSMYDTISESNPFNLLVLDEVFEGLDDENVEIVGDLVKQKSRGRSLFVITHKRTFIPNGSNLINL